PRCTRLVAKPEYSSPPDEVCCWQGRRGTAAGRGSVAESHREDVAGQGHPVTEQQGLAADAKMLL
ncbi:MAG: hypothetical protein SOW22_05485, partial [Candidatus Egerieousia sp.]|nr:hypothetical protein [Candidatus Egerieousia sp.]